MREIRFRGIGQISKEMVFGDLIHGVGHKKGNVYILPNEHNLAYVKNCDPLDGVRVIAETVGQYIGLNDKNGKELFVGDIVRDRFNRIMEVGWWNYKLCWIAISETNFHHADFHDWIKSAERAEDDSFPPVKTMTEIIGNRFEHPELIYNSKNSIHSPKP